VSWCIWAVDRVGGKGLGLWMLGFGSVRELVGEYIPSSATFLCVWGRLFQLVYCALLGFNSRHLERAYD